MEPSLLVEGRVCGTRNVIWVFEYWFGKFFFFFGLWGWDSWGRRGCWLWVVSGCVVDQGEEGIEQVSA